MTTIIRASGCIQLWCLQHPNFLTKSLLTVFYSVDVIIYSLQGARSFLTKRSEIFGSNYAALGRLIVGEYNMTAELIKNPQQRGAFLGRARLLRQRLPPDFLLFLSDKDAGGSDHHQTLHNFIWNNLLIQAQNRLSDPQLQQLIDELVQSAQLKGNPPAAKAITPDVQRMVIRYMMLVLLEVKLNEAQVETIRKLFYTGGLTSSYITAALIPLAPPGFLLGGLRRNIDEITQLIQNSPALKDYTPSTANYNSTKQEWSSLLLAVIGIAALGGGGNLATYILSEIPADFPIDTSDKAAVQQAVLETARRHAPVNNVNVIIPKPMEFQVAGKACTLPEGTVVAASIGLASLDAEQFPDPNAFKPDRDNLMSAMLSFNSIGFHATNDTGRRTCPGRNVALTMCSDLLITWRNAVS